MSDIYVCGHRNPDTDSIVAAIAYANLHRALGDMNYKAVRIGSVNDETRHILEYFNYASPEKISNVRTQVRDIDFDHPTELNYSVSMDLAWKTMRDDNITTMPILNDDCTLYAMLSAGDLASYDMQTIVNSRIDNVPVFNLLSVLEGHIINEFDSSICSVSGDVIVALPKCYGLDEIVKPDSIVICGNQSDVMEQALNCNAACIIVCQSEIEPRFRTAGASTCIISTPFDARQTARLVFQAVPVTRVCKTEEIISFHLDDYIDDVTERMTTSRYRCYPVLDENEHVVGTISRYHLLRPNRKKLVLVDHNEASQSVLGLNQAEIVGIIDHHRLADIQTMQPVYVRNEPVGSTNTIIATMYQENGVVPPPQIAGLMAAAILSDTVIFKSPTCTKRDRIMTERLCRMAGVDLDTLSKEIFSANHNGTVKELFGTDYKQFNLSDKHVGVSQITCSDSTELLKRGDEFVEYMEQVKKENKFDAVILMITDILLDGTHLYYAGSDDIIKRAFAETPKNNHVFLPGVISRKKQVIPMLTALWG